MIGQYLWPAYVFIKKLVLNRTLQKNSYQFRVSKGAQVGDAILGQKIAAGLCDVKSQTTILATAEFGRTVAGNSTDRTCGLLPCRLRRAVKIGKILLSGQTCSGRFS